MADDQATVQPDVSATGSNPFFALHPSPPPSQSTATAPDDAISSSDNPFFKMHPPQAEPAQPQSPSIQKVVGNVGAGASNLIAEGAGSFVDGASYLLNKLGLPTNSEPIGGSQSIKRAMGLMGANPDLYSANSMPEKIARGAGAGIAAMLLPQAAIGALGETGAVAPGAISMAQKFVGAPTGVGSVLADTVMGATSGAAATGAEEAAPEPYKPLAGMAAGLVGGVGSGLAIESARQVPNVARGVIQAAKPIAASVLPSAAESGARDIIAGKADSIAATRDALENEPSTIVPGSTPTTFQATGDMGLGSLERDLETKNPQEFQQRRQDQNQARVSALQGAQPDLAAEDANKAVAGHLTQRLQEIGDQADKTVQDATQQALAKTQGLGGTGTPLQYGQQIAGAVEPQIAGATQTASNAVSALGGQGTPEAYGNALRGVLAEANSTEKLRVSTLYRQVDPNEELAVGVNPIKAARDKVYGDQTQAAASGISPDEARISGLIDSYPDVVPFKEFLDLRTEISAASRAERAARGETPAYGRLSALRTGLEDTLDSDLQSRLADEQAAQAQREAANPAEVQVGSQLATEAQQYSAARRQAARAGNSAAENVAGGNSGVSPVSGTKVSQRLPDNAGDHGLQEEQQPLLINFNDEAAQRLRDASAAHRVRIQTYAKGPVGEALRTQGMVGDYRAGDAAVANKFFPTGGKGYEAVQSYLRGAGAGPQAVEPLADYATMSLRRAAERPDGTIDPRKFQTWQAAHQDALRAIGEVRSDLAQRFQSAADLSAHVQGMRPYSPDTDISKLPGMFFRSGPTGQEGVATLRQTIGDANANTILTDHAASSLRDAAEDENGVIDPKKFDSWRNKHQEALRAFPALDAKFADAAEAGKAVQIAAVARKNALDDYQSGAIGKILGAKNSEDATRIVGGILGSRDRVAQMGRLTDAVSDSPAAKDGLRRLVVDHMFNKFMSNVESGTTGISQLKSDPFQTFVRDSGPALKGLFSNDELNSFAAIASDLRRSNRSVNALKLPGRSNTPQDVMSAIRSTPLTTWLSKVADLVVGGAALGVGFEPITALAAALGTHAVTSMRNAGISRIDDLVKEAMLKPDVMKALLAKVSVKPDAGSASTLGQRFRKYSVLSPVAGTIGAASVRNSP